MKRLNTSPSQGDIHEFESRTGHHLLSNNNLIDCFFINATFIWGVAIKILCRHPDYFIRHRSLTYLDLQDHKFFLEFSGLFLYKERRMSVWKRD